MKHQNADGADRVAESIDSAVIAYVDYGEDALRSEIERALTLCQSPIERMLLPHLATLEMPFFDAGCSRTHWHATPFLAGAEADWRSCRANLLIDHPTAHDNESAVIFPQAQIGDYRADFLILVKLARKVSDVLKIVIECDGHDFHERTKEQAMHDRSRDRTMVTDGFKVLRFTGSEIWRDPAACAKEVRQFIWNEEYRTRDEREA